MALYQLDSVGNRVGERKAPSSAVSALTAAAFLLVPSAALSNDVLASFNRVDSLQSVVDSRAPAKNASFLWDEAGNLVRQTTASRDRRFDWDIKQTLTRVADDGLESGRYDYGSDGLRTKRLTSLESVEYVLDGDEVLLETDGASPAHPARRRYTYGASALAVTDINGSTRTTRALHVDALGSPGTETTLSASIAVNRQYDAWGAYRNGTAPTEVDAKLGFTGHQYDVETGLTYARARYYDAEYGRFLSRDSVEGSLNDAPSLHRYAYVRANPLRYRDPSGHEGDTATAGCAAGNVSACVAAGMSEEQAAAHVARSAGESSLQGIKFVANQPLGPGMVPAAPGAAPLAATVAAPTLGQIGTQLLIRGAFASGPVIAAGAYSKYSQWKKETGEEEAHAQAMQRADQTVVRVLQSDCKGGVSQACKDLVQLAGGLPKIELPAPPEREGVVIEEPATGGPKQLPSIPKPGMIDDLARSPIIDSTNEAVQVGPNPWGQPGNPDHQWTILQQIEIERTKLENIGKIVRPGKKGDIPNSDRIPDVVIENPEIEAGQKGNIERAIEVGRTTASGEPVAREQVKKREYESIGIQHEFVKTQQAPDEFWEAKREERKAARAADGKSKPDPGPRPPNIKY